MDPYIGQKLVAEKHRTLLSEAESERLARLASIGNRALWKAAQRAFALAAQRLSPVAEMVHNSTADVRYEAK